MIELIALALSVQLSVAQEPTETYLGLGLIEGQVCDINAVHAVENEITRSLCLQALDPVCMREFQRGRIAVPPPSKSDPDTARNKVMAAITDTRRLVPQRKSVMEAWLRKTNKGKQDNSCETSFAYPAKEVKTQTSINTGELIEGALGWVPFLGNLISSVRSFSNVMTYEEYVDNSVSTCNWSSIHVPSRKVDADCVPNFKAETPEVRHFLRQSDEFKKKAIQNPNTCSYYNRLLAILYTHNEVTERTLARSIKSGPNCMGKDRVELELESLDRFGESTYKIRSNLSANGPNVVMKPEIPGLEVNSSMTVQYTDKGKGVLCETRSSRGMQPNDEIRTGYAASIMAASLGTACCDTQDPEACMATHKLSKAKDSNTFKDTNKKVIQ